MSEACQLWGLSPDWKPKAAVRCWAGPNAAFLFPPPRASRAASSAGFQIQESLITAPATPSLRILASALGGAGVHVLVWANV